MGLKEARPLISNPAAVIALSSRPPPSHSHPWLQKPSTPTLILDMYEDGERSDTSNRPPSWDLSSFHATLSTNGTNFSITTGSTSTPCQGLGGSTHLPISHVDSMSDPGIEEDRSSGGLYSVSRPTPDLSRSLRLRTPTGRSHSITLPRNPALPPLDCQQGTGGGGRKFPSSHHWVRRDHH